jgi:segregation and condensation protein B
MNTLDDNEEGAPIDTSTDEETAPAAAPAPANVELDLAVEALLFVSRAPLSISALSEVVGCSPAALREGVARLGERYAEGRSGIVLSEVAGGYQLRSAESQKDRVRQLLGVKPQRLTRAAMETLALVAYRQPITRPEIEEVRGVDCGAVLKALLERGMLRILGKKEEPGRPLLYGTTREFLSLFGLGSLSALPTLREFRELSEENRSLVERETVGETLPPSLAELADDSLAARLQDLETEEQRALADLEAAMAEAEARAKLMPAPDAARAGGDIGPADRLGSEIAARGEYDSPPPSE